MSRGGNVSGPQTPGKVLAVHPHLYVQYGRAKWSSPGTPRRPDAISPNTGISFDAARQVFDDPYVLIIEDHEDELGEMRYHAIGFVRHRLLVVVFVDRSGDNEEITHILSVRKAVDYEEKAYTRQFTQGD